MYTYKTVKKNKDVNKIMIEKAGLTSQFTFLDVSKKFREWVKLKNETKANLEISKAMMTNIEKNNPFILKLKENEMHAVFLYYQRLKYSQDLKSDIVNLDKNIKSYIKEIPKIKEVVGIKTETDADVAIKEYVG